MRQRMGTHRNLLAGFFLVSSLIVFVVLVLVLFQRKGFFELKFNLFAVFESGIGLREGADVQFNGVKIGRVESVKLALVEKTIGAAGKVVLHLKIDKRFNHLITDRSVAFALRDKNLVSDRVINIENLAVSGTPLADGDTIRVSDSRDIESVLSNLTALMGKMDELLMRIGHVVNLTTDPSTTVGALLGSREMYDKLVHGLERVENLVDNGEQVVRQTGTIAADVVTALPGLLDKTDSITGRLLATSIEVERLSRSANRLADESGETLSKLDMLLLDGTDQLGKAGDLVDAVSNFWLIRRKMEDHDDFPLLGNGAGL